MTAAIVLLLIVPSALCAIDAIRRTPDQWAHADRDKTFWVTWLVGGAILPIFPIVFVPAYLLGVLPRMTAASPRSKDPFAK